MKLTRTAEIVDIPKACWHMEINGMIRSFCVVILTASALFSQEPPALPKKNGSGAPRVIRPGVSTAGVKRGMDRIKPVAETNVLGVLDWQAVTSDALWVSNGPKNTVHRIDVMTNKVVAVVEVGPRPCSGLAVGFGSLWVPLCGARGTGAGKGLARVDLKTNKVVATIPIGPADSEGGVTVSLTFAVEPI